MNGPPIDLSKAYHCACGSILTDNKALADHSISCGFMQKEGYSTFYQFLGGVLDKFPVDETRMTNFRNIFEMRLASFNQNSHSDIQMVNEKGWMNAPN